MRISKFFKNYRSKQALREENQRLINENEQLIKMIQRPIFNRPTFDTIQFDIKNFAVEKCFNSLQYMNLSPEARDEIIAHGFLEAVKEYMEIQEVKPVDIDAVSIIARLNFAVKK